MAAVATAEQTPSTMDFDDLTARGVQLVANGSFEATNREGTAPSEWGSPMDMELVTDARASKHGARYLTLRPEGLRYLYGKLVSVPTQKCRATAWVRGKGELAFVVGMVRPNWRNVAADRKFLSRQTSPTLEVDTEDWTRHEWEFECAESYEVDGERLKPEFVQFQLAVRGEVSVDACCVALATEATRAATPAARDDLRQLLTAPRIAPPPRLDGKMDADEWAGAAAVTGFTELNKRTLSRRPATVFVAHDQANLYLAFRCPQEGRIEQIPGERDQPGPHQNEGVELWLQPPDRPWCQFLLTSGGAVLDANETDHLAWNPDWTFAQSVADVAEEIGGILSFRRKLWTVEVAIPFAELGGPTPGDGEPEDVVIAGGHFSPAGWLWPEQWCHEIWVGDDERGLSVMCETREPLRGQKRTEILRSDAANTLRIHLIDGPCTLEGRLPYRYAWQATPVKPRPVDPLLWHCTYRRRQTDEVLRQKGVPNRHGVNLDMWGLKYTSYPGHFRNRRAFDANNKWLQDKGTKIVPYFGTNLVTTEVEALQPFRSEWEAYPTRIGSNPRGGWYLSCPQCPHVRDYMVDATRGIVDDLGYDGLCLDVSSCSGCKNHYHGCGYRDPDTGESEQTVPVFANRELYKRLYRLNKSDGRDAWLFRHGMPVAAVAGFVDVVTQGEDWCREGNDQYDRLTPEIFRAREMRIQYGTPYTWYTFHHYYRGIKFGGRIPLTAILAYCLPHRVLPTEGRVGMWPVWDVADRFWTDAEFLPYWSNECPAHADAEGVLTSVYLRREAKEALLVVANWATEPRSTQVTLDLEKLGMPRDRVKVTRALEHPIRQPEDPDDADTMGNPPVSLNAGGLSLALGARNVEVLLLTVP